jgi:hypothetical protein
MPDAGSDAAGGAAWVPHAAVRNAARPPDGHVAGETCDYCGAAALAWRTCKLVCRNCGNIVKSCADL